MLVAWCHYHKVNGRSRPWNDTSTLVKQCMGCTIGVGETKASAGLATNKY